MWCIAFHTCYQTEDNFIAIFFSSLILIVAYYSALVCLLHIVIWQVFQLFPMLCCNEKPEQSLTCRNWLFLSRRTAWPRAKESAILASTDIDLLPPPPRLCIKISTNRRLLILTHFLFVRFLICDLHHPQAKKWHIKINFWQCWELNPGAVCMPGKCFINLAPWASHWNFLKIAFRCGKAHTKFTGLIFFNCAVAWNRCTLWNHQRLYLLKSFRFAR